MLVTIGMTPPEFGALDDDIRSMYESYYRERQRRESKQKDALVDEFDGAL